MNPAPALHPSLAEQLFGGHPDRRLALLRATWPQVVGAELARRTRLLELQGATLRVAVPDAAWRKVLHGLQPTLRAKLQALLGGLAPTRLSFQELAPLDTTEPARPASAAAPPPDRVTLDPSLHASAQAIADPEVRERFLLTAARALARTRPRSAPKEFPDA